MSYLCLQIGDQLHIDDRLVQCLKIPEIVYIRVIKKTSLNRCAFKLNRNILEGCLYFPNYCSYSYVTNFKNISYFREFSCIFGQNPKDIVKLLHLPIFYETHKKIP